MRIGLKTARNLSLAGRHEAAIIHFKKLLEVEDGSDPLLKMEAAFAFDRAGRESEAIPLYRSALTGGLPDKSKIDVYFCLASSYRNIGNPGAAQRIAREAVRQFPEEPHFQIILAILDLERGKSDSATSRLLQVISNHVPRRTLDPYRWFLNRESRRRRRAQG